MWYQTIQYLKFLIKSTNQHGVHSPFVYDLVTKCFYDKTNFQAYQDILGYRKNLIHNQSKIKLSKDIQKIKPDVYSISELVKHRGITHSRSKLLYRLTQYLGLKNVFEIGTSLGITTQAMLLANPGASITTIEDSPPLFEFTKSQFLKPPLKKTTLINAGFEKAFQNLNNKSFDLVFFNNSQHEELTLHYFETLLSTIHNDSVFIFNDIYWSKKMTEAWEMIKQHPKVTVTIDTFHWGFVFFRKEQHKEHFTIRV